MENKENESERQLVRDTGLLACVPFPGSAVEGDVSYAGEYPSRQRQLQMTPTSPAAEVGE